MSEDRPIRYFDHAATSWPKPQEVMDAVARAMVEAGGNPGRGAHPLALAAARTIASARSNVARLLGVEDDRNIIFTGGCTEGINLVLKGTLKRGDRVVVSAVEHNAVVRPLALIAAEGIDIVVVPSDAEGRVEADDLESAVSAAPTRMVICQHASNVTGAIQPIGDFADIAHAHGAVILVDGAQAVGHLPVDLGDIGADAYAAPAHKGLLGPQGVGVLYLAPDFDPDELVQGGSGGKSEDSVQPRIRPDRYEAGTANTPGIAGVGAGAAFLLAHADEIMAAEQARTSRLHAAFAALPGVRVLGPEPGEPRVPVLSVTCERADPDEIAFALDRRYGIAVRAGLHCSPWAHEAVGTLDSGAVRFSLGHGVSDEDVDVAIEAMREICG